MKIIAAITVLLMAPAIAIAHHDGAVTRLDFSSSPPSARGDGNEAEWHSGVSYQFARYGRVLGENEEANTLGDGSIEVHALQLESTVFFGGGWSTGISLPIGVSTTRPADGDDVRTTGLGDLMMNVSRDFVLGPLRARASVGGVLPTGRYEPENTLTVNEFVTDGEGALELATFDTRASLGADAFAAFARASTWLDLNVAVIQAELQAMQPLTETSDEILWGADLVGRVSLAHDIGPLRAALGGVYRRHFRDRLTLLEEGREIQERLGGRHDLGAVVEVSAALTDRVRCGAGARIPVWQEADTLQLAQSFSASLRCGLEVDI